MWTKPRPPVPTPAGANGRRAVLVVGGKLKIVRKARALGLDVVHLQHPGAFTPAHAEQVTAGFLFDYHADADLAVQVARVAATRYPIRHALSLTEDGLVVAGRITDALGLPGTSAEVAVRCRNKSLMRRHLAAVSRSGGAALRSALVAAASLDGPDGLRRFGAAHGWPVIVKPADASASVGTLLVRHPGQVEAICAQVQAWRRSTDPPFRCVDRFVVEEFVPGPEVSVETMSSGGRHVVLAITEKLLQPDGFVEIGHALPARLAPPTAEAVRAATASVLDAIGLRDGPSHTEFRLQDGVPRLIETHNRVGGDRIHDMVEAACGVDLDRLWIGGPVGLVPPLAGPPPVSCAAATRFVLAEPGEVVAIDGVEEVRAHPAVIGFDLGVGVGDRVGPLRTSWDRIGQVLVTAPTTAAAVALADDLAARIRVVTR